MYRQLRNTSPNFAKKKYGAINQNEKIIFLWLDLPLYTHKALTFAMVAGLINFGIDTQECYPVIIPEIMLCKKSGQ